MQTNRKKNFPPTGIIKYLIKPATYRYTTCAVLMSGN